jgi:hypothetical protein
MSHTDRKNQPNQLNESGTTKYKQPFKPKNTNTNQEKSQTKFKGNQLNYNKLVDLFCNFCANQNVPEEECKGHTPRTCERLKEYECPSCKEKGHTRNHCTALFCKFCREKDHEIANCPQIVDHTCKKCKKVGHRENKCTNYCSYCRDAVGHQIENCPEKECNFCGEVGHLSGPDCPMRQYSYRHKDT